LRSADVVRNKPAACGLVDMGKKANRSAELSRAAASARPVVALRPAVPKPFGYFDRAYLINRERDADRLAKMSARLERIGVPFERFAAVEARADERLFPDKPQLTPGYFACARSHLAVLRMAMQPGHERVMVLEDDAVFRDDTAERMARIVPRLRGIDWDVFYFGLHLLEAGGRISEELGIVRRSFHAHAYAVSRRALPAMIEMIESAMRAGFHFDCHEMAGKRPLLRLYADPILAVQEPNVSGVLGEKVDRLGAVFSAVRPGGVFRALRGGAFLACRECSAAGGVWGVGGGEWGFGE
jgi:hypothetical protein